MDGSADTTGSLIVITALAVVVNDAGSRPWNIRHHWSLSRRLCRVFQTWSRRRDVCHCRSTSSDGRRLGAVIAVVLPHLFEDWGTAHHHGLCDQVVRAGSDTDVSASRIRRCAAAVCHVHGKCIAESGTAAGVSETCSRVMHLGWRSAASTPPTWPTSGQCQLDIYVKSGRESCR